jgi:hypothetical protein
LLIIIKFLHEAPKFKFILSNPKVEKCQPGDKERPKACSKVISQKMCMKAAKCFPVITLYGSRALLRFFGGGGFGKLGDKIIHQYAHQLATQILSIPKKGNRRLVNYANFCND